MALPPLPAGYESPAEPGGADKPQAPPLPAGYSAPQVSVLPKPPAGYEVPNPGGAPAPAATTLPKYDQYIDKYSSQFGVDPKAIRSMLSNETSGGRNITDSKAGAQGIGQFMPETATKYGVDPKNDESGIRGMAHYYADLLKQFHGDKALAAVAYNAGPGAVQNWLDGKGQLSKESIDYMAKFNRAYYGKDNLQAKQSAQQQETPADLAAAAKLSSNLPGPQNPLRFNLFGSTDAIKTINDKLSVAGAALNAAGSELKKDVYKPGNKAWLGLKQTLQNAGMHPLQTFVNVEGALMRPAMALHAAVAKNADPTKVGPPDTGRAALITTTRQMYKNVQDGEAVMKTAADFFMHPTHMSQVLHSITHPEDTETLTDTLEAHWAKESGLPSPDKWNVAAKLAADITTQGAHDLFSYVGVGDLVAPIRAGMETLSHATMGMGVAHAIGLSMSNAAKAGSKIASKAPLIQDAVKKVNDFTSYASTVGNGIKKAINDARPNLDPHLTPDGKIGRYAIEDASDNVKRQLNARGEQLITSGGADAKSAFDPLDRDTMHFRLANVYKFGDADSSEAAVRMGKLVGWSPSVSDMANSAQGLVKYDPKNLYPRILSYVVPKDAPAEVNDAMKFFKQHKGILDIGAEYPTLEEVKTGADLERMGSATQAELLRHSFALEHEAIRNGYIQRQTATMMKENPGFFSEEAMKKVMLNAHDRMFSQEMGVLGDPKKAVGYQSLLDHPEAFEDAFKTYFDDAAKYYAGKEIPNRPDKFAENATGGWAKVRDALNDVSKWWKSSLTGTGWLVHSLRNVGTIASMVASSPMVAAKGVMYGLKGVPDALKARMQAGGSWSHFWQETPELLKSLSARTAAGGVLGGAAGNAQAPKDADPLTRMKDIGIGAAIGAGAGAILPATTKLMDRFENGIRAGYLEDLDRKLGPAETAGDEYARHGKVTQDLGGYTHVTQLVSFMQGIGGTFVAYRLGTVPRAFFDTLAKRTGRIANAERAQQDIGAKLPANHNANPSKAPVELHALGPMDEGVNMSIDALNTVTWAGGFGPGQLDPTGFGASPATIGQGPAMVAKGLKDAYYTKEHPESLGQTAAGLAYSGAGFLPGGSMAQNLTPLNPYKDKTGLPFWAQELMNLMSDYGTSQSIYEQKLERRGYAKAQGR